MLPGEGPARPCCRIAEFDLDQMRRRVTTLRGAVGLAVAPGTLAIANRYMGASITYSKRYADAVARIAGHAPRPSYAQASEELGLTHHRLGRSIDALAAHGRRCAGARQRGISALSAAAPTWRPGAATTRCASMPRCSSSTPPRPRQLDALINPDRGAAPVRAGPVDQRAFTDAGASSAASFACRGVRKSFIHEVVAVPRLGGRRVHEHTTCQPAHRGRPSGR